jgi:hypothetical protein
MKGNTTLSLFLGLWIVINILQAYFTGLLHDEAYYFFYSRELAWGYYDHPPLTALLINLGYAFIPNELGVRILFVILSVGTLLIIRRLWNGSDHLLFLALAFSFIFFHISGFLAIPDSLLIFFSALFFLVYKRYSESGNYFHAVLLGLVMAGLFYSKYLGIFIVFFTVISNIKLLWRPSFWLAVIVTTLAFLPHLLWQYQHDFPTIYYHFLERSHDEIFRWKNFADYTLGQFGLTNPFLIIPFFYLIFKFKPKNLYEKALKYAALGSLLLPFVFMIRGRVEANWSMAGLVPFFLLCIQILSVRPRITKFIYIFSGITLLIIVFVRLLIMEPLLPDKIANRINLEMNGWESFSKKVERLASGRPVVFVGSYQTPSHYIFETGNVATTFNNVLYRNNQFDLRQIEKDLQGKEALVILPRTNFTFEDIEKYNISLDDSIRFPNNRFQHYLIARNFRSYNFIPIKIDLKSDYFTTGGEISADLIMNNPYDKPVYFRDAKPSRVYLTYWLLFHGKPLYSGIIEEVSDLVLTKDYIKGFTIPAPEAAGTYYLRISIKSGWMPPGINSRLVKIRVNQKK